MRMGYISPPVQRFRGVTAKETLTYEEALENLKDAIRLHIQARRDVGDPIPIEVVID